MYKQVLMQACHCGITHLAFERLANSASQCSICSWLVSVTLGLVCDTSAALSAVVPAAAVPTLEACFQFCLWGECAGIAVRLRSCSVQARLAPSTSSHSSMSHLYRGSLRQCLTSLYPQRTKQAAGVEIESRRGLVPAALFFFFVFFHSKYLCTCTLKFIYIHHGHQCNGFQWLLLNCSFSREEWLHNIYNRNKII